MSILLFLKQWLKSRHFKSLYIKKAAKYFGSSGDNKKTDINIIVIYYKKMAQSATVFMGNFAL